MDGDLLLIQRFGRWRPNSFLSRWRRDLTALGPLSTILARTTGILVKMQHRIHQTSAQIRLTECRAWLRGRSEHYQPALGGWREDPGHSGAEAENPFDESADKNAAIST